MYVAVASSEMLYKYSRKAEDEWRRWEPEGFIRGTLTEASGEVKSGNLSTSSVTMARWKKKCIYKDVGFWQD